LRHSGFISQVVDIMVRAICSPIVVVSVAIASVVCPGLASDKKNVDEMSTLRRQQVEQMLKDVRDKVEKEYYDPSFHGVNLDARYKDATQKMSAMNSFSEALGIIAWFLDALNDSHTNFVPPPRPYLIRDGWEASFVGQKCFVTAVKPGSDAAAKGLKPGDWILSIDGFQPTRENWRKLYFAFHYLAPRSGMKLVVSSPEGQPRELMIMSEVRPLPAQYSLAKLVAREFEEGDLWDVPITIENGGVLIWKLPRFLVSDDQIDDLLRKANKHNALIIDLRGNPGGAEENLSRLVSGLFDHDVKIADRDEKKQAKPLIAKSRGSHAYTGKLVVLIDSRSASASELFARVVQLEKRGIVIGDRSAGAVMEARTFPLTQGAALGEAVFCGVEVTVADLKMADGKSLEHVGVTPDEIVLPSPDELAAGADPQLSVALQKVGVPLSSAAAGQLFPAHWK